MITYSISSNFCKKTFLWDIFGFTIFHLSRIFFYWRFLIYFISTEKWNKKGKYPNRVQILTFLLEHRYVWRQGFQKKFQKVIWSENVFKDNFQRTFVLMKSSWRRLDQDEYVRLSLKSSEDVFKTPSRRLGQDQYIRLGHMSSRRFQDVFKTSSRRFQDVFKTSCKNVFKTSSRRLAKTSSRRL